MWTLVLYFAFKYHIEREEGRRGNSEGQVITPQKQKASQFQCTWHMKGSNVVRGMRATQYRVLVHSQYLRLGHL
jgi:hypothetical protein